MTGAAVDFTGLLGKPAVIEGAETKSGQPRRRVPARDIVYVGPRVALRSPSEPVDVRDLAFTPRAASLAVAPGASPRRNLTRPLLALLVLEIAVASGLYFGKRYAEAHVIVVPAATSEHSVIT